MLASLKVVGWVCTAMAFSLVSVLASFDDNRFYLAFCRLNQSFWRMFGLRVFLFGDELMLVDNVLLISNHRSMFDILAIFYISGHYNRIVLFCLKRMVCFIPGIGLWCLRMGFPVLHRNQNDITTLAGARAPEPILIYPEGARYTNRKHAENALYAKQTGRPISKNALLPKYKGSFILSQTRNVVYQMTLVYLDSNGLLQSGECLTCPSRIYIHVKKHANVPEHETDYSQWMSQQFENIDELYGNFRMPLEATEMKPTFHVLDYWLYTAFASSSIVTFWYVARLACTLAY